MKFALDAMGGDNAPQAVVHGALEALSGTPETLELVLVGNERRLKADLPTPLPDRLSLLNTSQVVKMHDRASNILKTKPDSSIVRGVRLVKEGKVDGFISAGNTGAIMTASLLVLGRIPGVRRPALGAYIPTVKGGKMICDVGTNPDAKPYNLLQFAIMASHYIQQIEGNKNPRIGLINIGAEPGKGSEMYQEAYELLNKELPNFVGNVEGRHLLDAEADVLVCDGFVGNTVLKFGEGWINIFRSDLRSQIRKNLSYKLGALLLKPVFDQIRRRYDYEEHGGTPLLGINSISIICHGSSGSKAIKNSVNAAKKCVDANLIETTKVSLAEHIGAHL
jgi:glycerol-3-phosphate acyltransferase PlsX